MKHPGLLSPEKTPRLANNNGSTRYNQPVAQWTEKQQVNRQHIKDILLAREVLTRDGSNSNKNASDIMYYFDQLPTKISRLNKLELDKRSAMQTLKSVKAAINYVKADIRSQKNQIKILDTRRFETVSPIKNVSSTKEKELNDMRVTLGELRVLRKESTESQNNIQRQLNAFWNSIRLMATLKPDKPS